MTLSDADRRARREAVPDRDARSAGSSRAATRGPCYDRRHHGGVAASPRRPCSRMLPFDPGAETVAVVGDDRRLGFFGRRALRPARDCSGGWRSRCVGFVDGYSANGTRPADPATCSTGPGRRLRSAARARLVNARSTNGHRSAGAAGPWKADRSPSSRIVVADRDDRHRLPWDIARSRRVTLPRDRGGPSGWQSDGGMSALAIPVLIPVAVVAPACTAPPSPAWWVASLGRLAQTHVVLQPGWWMPATTLLCGSVGCRSVRDDAGGGRGRRRGRLAGRRRRPRGDAAAVAPG